MVGLLESKFWSVVMGVILIVISIAGMFLLDYCKNPESLSESVQGSLEEPFLMRVVYFAQDIFSDIASFFVSILCPVVGFFGNLLDYLIWLVFGILLIVVGIYLSGILVVGAWVGLAILAVVLIIFL